LVNPAPSMICMT